MLFLTQMPTVIRPQHHDGILGIRPFIECIQNMTKHGVGKINRGQVPLYRIPPLLVGTDMGKVTVWPQPFAFSGKIFQIILTVSGRQLDFINWERIKIFLRDKPRLVRPVNSTGEKERFVMFL